MSPFLLTASLLLPALLGARPLSSLETEPASTAALAQPDWQMWIGEAKGPLVLNPGGEPTSMAELVRAYERLTGIRAMASDETRSLLQAISIGIEGEFTVEAAEVPGFVHCMLRGGDFAITPMRASAPVIIGIESLRTQARNTIRGSVIYVKPEELAELAHYPAMLVTTTVTLEHVDVRQLSNAMRTMITDANTQQLLPAGNTNSMVLVGYPDQLLSVVKHLGFINEECGRLLEQASAAGVIRLHYGQAAEVCLTVQGVFRAEAVVVEGGESSAAVRRAPRIVPDERTNSLIVLGSESDLRRVRELVKVLDIEVGK